MQLYSALLDRKSNAVLIASTHISAIVFLNKHVPDTVHWPLVQSPNHEQSFPLHGLVPEQYPNWHWDEKARLFSQTTPHDVAEALRERAQLTAAKFGAISKVMFNINAARYQNRSGIEFQETVYLLKRLQAEGFIASNYDESRASEFPLVVQYADFSGCTLRTAADDIRFKARLYEDLLAKSEILRMKYFQLIGDAAESALPEILGEFYRDCYENALVA